MNFNKLIQPVFLKPSMCVFSCLFPFFSFSLCLEFLSPAPLPQLNEAEMIWFLKVFKNIIFKNLLIWYCEHTLRYLHDSCIRVANYLL